MSRDHSLSRVFGRSRTSLCSLAAPVLALGLGGCEAALWGNTLVLAVTLGIFFGTLALGRGAPSSAEASTSAATSRRS